ncbi:MAG: 30S ribosomal protein S4 [Candidatus Marinimicrobia bacterium]|nr:30S ribosomal protein S4 [Candidatus Neomarinimicrobiota bacterium]MBL7046377.1 30S ribosomal protein S4 [Candidatus Neomarinimicrobiota bacterium]
MAKYTGMRGKIVRRFGDNIFGNPKFDRILERKNYGPGQHGQSRRRRPSNYGLQLMEKQKMKYTYGLLERQFRRFYKKAEKMKGETGINLVQLLERRLDNVVFRLGFATTRNSARQLVNHKHFLVNGKPANIPSYIVKPNDEIKVRDKSRKLTVIHDSLKRIKGDLDLPWLKLDKATLTGTFLQIPERDQIKEKFTEQLVVELYSK